MPTFELYYRMFEQQTQKHKLYTTFHFTFEEVFENLEISDVNMSTDHSIIYTIVNRKLGNTFHHHNGPNHCQQLHKNTRG